MDTATSAPLGRAIALSRAIPLSLIVICALAFHGPLLMMQVPANSFDANFHMSMASHYSQHWFDPWNEKAFAGFSLPLDIIVNDESLWVTDLSPLRITKLDFKGNHLYTWMVPKELPDGYLEVHTFTVDSNGNLYGGDNQYGRTQKFVPKRGADPALFIGRPWVAR